MQTAPRPSTLVAVVLVCGFMIGLLAGGPGLPLVYAGITPSPTPTVTPTLVPPTETPTPPPPTETPTATPAPTDTPEPAPVATATPEPTLTEVPVTIPETGASADAPLLLILGGAGLLGLFLVVEGRRRIIELGN